MNVKHPVLALFIWFFMGYLALEYGIENVAYWVAFVLGAIAIYSIISKHLSP